MLAGYLRGERSGHHGLGGLLQAWRERRPFGEVIGAEAIDLPQLVARDEPVRFLPGFPHPGVVGLFGGAWPDLMIWTSDMVWVSRLARAAPPTAMAALALGHPA